MRSKQTLCAAEEKRSEQRLETANVEDRQCRNSSELNAIGWQSTVLMRCAVCQVVYDFAGQGWQISERRRAAAVADPVCVALSGPECESSSAQHHPLPPSHRVVK